MPSGLLDSQLRTVEEPHPVLTLSIELSPEILCERIVRHATRLLWLPPYPKDESALELLKRIQTEHEKVKNASKSRKKRK